MLETLAIFAARDLIFLLIIGAGVVFFAIHRKDRLRFAVLGTIGGGISFVLSRLEKLANFKPRPFTLDGIPPIIPHEADNGFPSDHALLAFTLAAIVYTRNRKAGIVFSIVATLIGTARVFLRIHSPIDIVGSLAISLVSVFAVHRILAQRTSK